ncbi:hypothetical protein JQ543_21245 [Bradyrhizobium diazoefficiens]|nr:hypothetical protein [Bradyrhizobium diazoefficiens]MBR0850285.1 hypothetical protein [Bradyrhizobium diazoefficiens]
MALLEFLTVSPTAGLFLVIVGTLMIVIGMIGLARRRRPPSDENHAAQQAPALQPWKREQAPMPESSSAAQKKGA